MKNLIIAILAILVLLFGYLLFINKNDAKAPGAENNETSGQQATSSGTTKDLSGQGLSSVPMSTFEDSSITTLDVSNNNLTGALPSQIQKLSKLEVLLANDNNFTGIPAEIGQLSKLKTINYANNGITGLPLELGNLSNLETLDLRGNPNVSTYDISQIQPKIPNAKILTD